MARKTVTLRPHEVPVTRYAEGVSGITKTLKKRIVPVRITVVLEADKVNENGTLSGFQIVSVKGPKTAYAVAPIQGGGSVYLKVESLEGLQVLGDVGETAKVHAKRKLF